MNRRFPAVAVLLAASLLPLARAFGWQPDPYPLAAAGWGPEAGGGRMASRWAEDLPEGTTFALRGELRLRQAGWRDAPGRGAGDVVQGQLRAVAGADWRPLPGLRVYGELGSGAVDRDRDTATANFRNALSVQQLFLELRRPVGAVLAGVMAGRQEFADGPRQLVSLGDGPNLHRSWNGLRGYVHARRWRLGAFDFRGTRLEPDALDDGVDPRTSLRGMTAGFVLGQAGESFIEPFWFRTRQSAHRIGTATGEDERDSIGLRAWGRRGALKFDALVLRQTGETAGGRAVSAWAASFGASMALSGSGWRPRLSSRIDLGSGGGAWGTGRVRTFHPLYASSNYVSEGQLLAMPNLLMLVPGVTLSPTPRTTLAFEWAHARRRSADDAVYATATRAYAGTQAVPGHHAADLLRLRASWSPDPRLSLRLTLEHLRAGPVLRRAGHGDAGFVYADLAVRY